jgi:PIN domain nuclease of toxin-antitoxin system
MILLDTHTAVWLASDQSKLSVDAKKALSVRLPEIHNDPFDRILIAMCQANEWTLISKDSMIAKYPDIRVVW